MEEYRKMQSAKSSTLDDDLVTGNKILLARTNVNGVRFAKNSQQENSNDILVKLFQSNLKNDFKIKIPFFPKRPFGKHDSLNTSELSFIEVDIKDKASDLFAKQSQFVKMACGRATSVGRRRDTQRIITKGVILRN